MWYSTTKKFYAWSGAVVTLYSTNGRNVIYNNKWGLNDNINRYYKTYIKLCKLLKLPLSFYENLFSRREIINHLKYDWSKIMKGWVCTLKLVHFNILRVTEEKYTPLPQSLIFIGRHTFSVGFRTKRYNFLLIKWDIAVQQ